MELNPIQAIKNWFAPNKKSNGYGDGSFEIGGLDGPAFRSWMLNAIGPDAFENLTFPVVAREGFEKNVITYKCVMSISEAIANLNYCLFNRTTNKQIASHKVLDLWDRPNPMQSGSSFRQHMVADLLLDGNSFIELVVPDLTNPNSTKPPVRLWALQPDFCQIIVGPSRIPNAIVYMPGGVESGDTRTFPYDPINGTSNCLHIKSYAPLREQQEGRGLSPVRSAWRQVLTHNEGALWNFYLLKQQAIPSGVLSTDGTLTDDQIKRMKRDLIKGGPRKAGQPLILDGGLKWSQMSLTPAELAFIEGKNSVARDIALALKTPPILLHIPGDTTYNNVTEAKLAWYEETIIPMAQTFLDEVNRCIVSRFDPNLELRIDIESITALTERRFKKWTMVNSMSCLTVNEKRIELGKDPVEDGDVILVPTTSTTLEDIVEGVQPGQPAPMPAVEGEEGKPGDPNAPPEQGKH
jgi:HK97 family phage portal protein